MIKKSLIIGLILLAGTFVSCGNKQGECKSGPLTASFSVSQAALSEMHLTGDIPGAQAVDRIDEILSSGRSLRMNIYELNSPDCINDLIQNRHFVSPQNIEDSRDVVIQDNETVCAWNRNSLYEQCINEPLFNSNPGVSREELKPDSFYISEALNILKHDLAPRTNAHYQFIPYKRKYGINGSAPAHEPENITETVFEVAVGFASELDGWPVIGPGGKAYIHLMPDGTPVAKKIYRKIPRAAVVTLSENDIKSPDEALDEVIQNNHIDMNKYKLFRSEFGYYYRGKNSIQNVIAPHYAFFFEPVDGRFDTRIYHIVSAVKGEASQIVSDDQNLELERKQNNIKDITPAQEKSL